MKVEDEKFPVGMRVLVVDDDPTCLKLMEALLLKCQYHGLFSALPSLFFTFIPNLFACHC